MGVVLAAAVIVAVSLLVAAIGVLVARETDASWPMAVKAGGLALTAAITALSALGGLFVLLAPYT
ncbi:hypothetical protein [Allonocardiopsis opalescens]|uniref:Uncharacterized protein n=1 Tax=Allonocardiopsis opalescens TaxID=1144618 RepID=A0A2T0Q754_9ACTN|nr:hypothetical protein [Allonocardiopsis opalescens]PRX99666.1 hypothetical protein CLV72_103271 [Allonocardiopsis opalescens]